MFRGRGIAGALALALAVLAGLVAIPAQTVAAAIVPGATASFTTPSPDQPAGPLKWPQPYSGVAVGDLNADGNKEIVAGFNDGRVYVFNRNLSVLPGWPKQTGGAILSSPTLADLFGNGKEEIIVTSTDGNVYVWNLDGSTVAGWPQRAWYGPANSGGAFLSIWGGSIAVGDLFGDGRKELVGASMDHFLYAWNINGSLLPGFPINLWDTAWTTPALVDLTHNGQLDIVVGSDSNGGSSEPYPLGGVIWAFPPTGCGSPNGSWRGGCNVSGWPELIDNSAWSPPNAVDIYDTSNAHHQVVSGTGHYVAGAGHHVFAWNENGSTLGGWPRTTGGPNFGAIAIGDLLGNGTRAIVASSEDGGLGAWDASGNCLPGFCKNIGGGFLSSPIIAPVNGSANGVWIGVGGELWGLDSSGNVAVKAFMGGPTDAPPTVTDLGDGHLSVIETAATNPDGNGNQQWIVKVFAVPGAPSAVPTGSWPTFHGNMQRSGTLAPTAHINALLPTQVSRGFSVSWSPDSNSVPATSYTIWSRDNGGRWLLWTTTSATSATFNGVAGHTYDFRVVAADRTGYQEGGETAQATTSVNNNAINPNGFNGVYASDSYGVLRPMSSPPIDNSDANWNFQVGRGVVLRADGHSGYTLDGFGAVHAFGGAPAARAPDYWNGWDIARDLVLNPCDPTQSSGWVLDGWGGLHAFGGAPAIDRSPSAYWQGWDIARKVAVNACANGHATGVVLDGWGGLHSFAEHGQAIPQSPAPSTYWQGWDIARGVVMSGPTQGYVLDGWGGLHPFGGANAPIVPSAYWQGWDIARGVALQPGFTDRGWVLDGWGGTHSFGPVGLWAPGLQTQVYTPGQDIVRGLSAA